VHRAALVSAFKAHVSIACSVTLGHQRLDVFRTSGHTSTKSQSTGELWGLVKHKIPGMPPQPRLGHRASSVAVACGAERYSVCLLYWCKVQTLTPEELQQSSPRSLLEEETVTATLLWEDIRMPSTSPGASPSAFPVDPHTHRPLLLLRVLSGACTCSSPRLHTCDPRPCLVKEHSISKFGVVDAKVLCLVCSTGLSLSFSLSLTHTYTRVCHHHRR
jgi:hypothetical protein